MYDGSGRISSQASVARARGTTVALRELFKPLPVRRKAQSHQMLSAVVSAHLNHATAGNAVCLYVSHERSYVSLPPQELLRNVRREFGKLLSLLQAYAVIGTGVRLICTNQVSVHHTPTCSPHLHCAGACCCPSLLLLSPRSDDSGCLADRHRDTYEGAIHPRWGRDVQQHRQRLWTKDCRGIDAF